ncbi:hypothetical protein [Agrococcus baldri]|uniref:hypothetical protein n=1 Tax=Agrococcus baldri TaxID=153730 RepID=UPI000B8200F2|nr:hypothetical protein [Agrococcus baldri]
MASIRSPDLRPLQQPLGRAGRRAARAWLREHRQATDVPGVGLAIAGWGLLLPGALILLVGLTSGDELEMTIVGAVMTAIGTVLLVWRWLRRRDALRRAAGLVPFAAVNDLSYAQRVRMPMKQAGLLRQGFDQLGVDVLRAADGAEWGVWRHRIAERRGGPEVLRGYLEVPWLGPQARAAEGGPPPGLQQLLREAPLPLELEVTSGRLTVVAARPWRMTDPDVQVLVHRIRSLVADQGRQPARAARPMPASIAQLPSSRRQALAALGAGAVLALSTIAVAFAMALVRNAA